VDRTLPVRPIPFDALPEALREQLRPRVERLGYLGEFFQCAAHQPRALGSFTTFTEQLREALPDRLTEVVALTVSVACTNAYERVQHERLALKLGYEPAWVDAVTACAPEHPGPLQEDERLVQRLCLAALADHGHGAADELAEVANRLGDDVAIAALLLVGRYALHALVVNALGLEPPVARPPELRGG
jgi:alkylhydroperoxidase family enzyme